MNWITRFNTCSFLDNHLYDSPHHEYECLVAAGIRSELHAQAGQAFQQLKEFSQSANDWLFGHFGFDLKNELEELSSQHPDRIGFDDLYFFVPEVVIEIGKDHLRIGSCESNHHEIFDAILQSAHEEKYLQHETISIQSRFSQEEYLDVIEKLQDHILYGDCYEINFCQEFFAENIQPDIIHVFRKLESISPMPFSAFYRVNNQYLLCASPERYLKKSGTKLITQPIKGTIHRHTEDSQMDFEFKEKLFNSTKDRSENVMVVDLMRNDLSRICEPGTVEVEELYGIYTFPQVHQMISTITGIVRKEMDWVDMISNSFPMGSMTGAPKKRVLELIEQYERSK
ncbi:MAG TPA: chorismate-binding protein, partial [Puia sp.]|nr:chorismate-binding protein [Puia sp.]